MSSIRQFATIGLTLGILAAMTSAAKAQIISEPYGDPAGYRSSPISPYLLLVPQTTSTGGTVSAPAGTYQALVRPMLEAQDQRQRQPAPQNQPYAPSPAGPGFQRTQQTTGIATNVRSTGHSATYQNLSHYYSTTMKHP